MCVCLYNTDFVDTLHAGHIFGLIDLILHMSLCHQERKATWGPKVKVNICDFIGKLQATFLTRLISYFSISFLIKRERTLMILGSEG